MGPILTVSSPTTFVRRIARQTNALQRKEGGLGDKPCPSLLLPPTTEDLDTVGCRKEERQV